MNEFNDDFLFKDEPDESTPLDADNLNIPLENTRALCSQKAGAHNAFFRGEDVTKYLDDGTLWERISSGKFNDLFVGDYIQKNDTIWRIAGFDYYLHTGDQGQGLTTHHAVIVPDVRFTPAPINSEHKTDGGYTGSDMFKTTLDSILADYITPVFGDHVLEYRSRLTTDVNASRTNRFGSATGASSGFNWFTRKLDLMSEMMVYGATVFSSSGYDIGSCMSQLPLFRLAPEFISNRTSYWLRDVATAGSFCSVNGYGNVFYNSVENGAGVRPYFLID